MKTTGVSCVPKFGLIVFLGHPTVEEPSQNIHTFRNIQKQNFHQTIFYEYAPLRGVGADLPPPRGLNRVNVAFVIIIIMVVKGSNSAKSPKESQSESSKA